MLPFWRLIFCTCRKKLLHKLQFLRMKGDDHHSFVTTFGSTKDCCLLCLINMLVYFMKYCADWIQYKLMKHNPDTTDQAIELVGLFIALHSQIVLHMSTNLRGTHLSHRGASNMCSLLKKDQSKCACVFAPFIQLDAVVNLSNLIPSLDFETYKLPSFEFKGVESSSFSEDEPDTLPQKHLMFLQVFMGKLMILALLDWGVSYSFISEEVSNCSLPKRRSKQPQSFRVANVAVLAVGNLWRFRLPWACYLNAWFSG